MRVSCEKYLTLLCKNFGEPAFRKTILNSQLLLFLSYTNLNMLHKRPSKSCTFKELQESSTFHSWIPSQMFLSAAKRDACEENQKMARNSNRGWPL